VGVVKIVAIEGGLELGEFGVRLASFGFVGAAQSLNDNRSQQTKDQRTLSSTAGV
jgi:hypothetical protein